MLTFPDNNAGHIDTRELKKALDTVESFDLGTVGKREGNFVLHDAEFSSFDQEFETRKRG